MANKRVFVDFHHAGLLRSLILLFEGRLGYEVYRPIGREWAENGFWKVYDHPSTVAQYLDVGGATPDGTQPLNELVDKKDNVYLCQDIDSGLTNKAITYDGFMSMDFDIVIASIPHHVEPFKKLCQLHPSKPKLIYQIGNAWTIEAGLAPNVMASAIINDVPKDVNFISYHQEFPLDIYKPVDEFENKTITSLINVFSGFPDYQLFLSIESKMPDWKFRIHGAQGRDKPLNGDKNVAKAIQNSMFIWHTKYGGDGYGHLLHNYFACGKPVIVKKNYYRDKMGERLLVDDVTCIVIDNLSEAEIINKIEYFSEPTRYQEMSKNCIVNFNREVNFEAEAIELKKFIENLK